MFGIGSWEFFLIAILALLLFGPDKLPEFARTIGRLVRDFKRYTSMMESTIRAEMYTAEPKTKPDPFKKGKEFREQVEAGTYAPADAEGGQAEAETEATAGEAPAATSADDTADVAEADAADAAPHDELPPDHPLHDARAAGLDIGVDDDLDLASIDPADLGWIPGSASEPTQPDAGGGEEGEA